MAGPNVRVRFSAIAAKSETTPGTDAIAGSPVLGDFVLGSGSFSYNPQMIADPSFSGSLDKLPGMIGAFMPNITMQVPLRGSGTAGTAPAFGKLLKSGGMEEVVDGTGVAAAALTAGTTTTGTLGTGASTTAQAYRGIPAILAVNPSGGAISPIMNYTAGKVATFGETFASALNTSTTVQIPPNVLYRFTDDETVMKWSTIYLYEDGFVYKFGGCVGSWKLDMTSGGSGMLTFTFSGVYLGAQAVALPTALTAGQAQALPIWVNGRSRFGGVQMRCRSLSIDAGNRVIMPDNPEAVDGYDPGVIMERSVVTTLDPRIDTTTQAGLIAEWKAGTSKPFFAILGSAPGNRFSVAQPAIRQVGGDKAERDGLAVNQIRGEANSAGSPLFLCAF